MTVDGGTNVTLPPPLPLPPTLGDETQNRARARASRTRSDLPRRSLPAWVRVNELKVREVLRDLDRGVPRYSSHSRVSVSRGHDSVSRPSRTCRRRRLSGGRTARTPLGRRATVNDAVGHVARIVRHLRLWAALIRERWDVHERTAVSVRPAVVAAYEVPVTDVSETQRARLVRAPVLHARHVARVTAVYHEGLSEE